MILFDPYTGEKRTPERVKTINEANYLCYLADEMAIKALEKTVALKNFIEMMKKPQYECFVTDRTGLIDILDAFLIEE